MPQTLDRIPANLEETSPEHKIVVYGDGRSTLLCEEPGYSLKNQKYFDNLNFGVNAAIIRTMATKESESKLFVIQNGVVMDPDTGRSELVSNGYSDGGVSIGEVIVGDSLLLPGFEDGPIGLIESVELRYKVGNDTAGRDVVAGENPFTQYSERTKVARKELETQLRGREALAMGALEATGYSSGVGRRERRRARWARIQRLIRRSDHQEGFLNSAAGKGREIASRLAAGSERLGRSALRVMKRHKSR